MNHDTQAILHAQGQNDPNIINKLGEFMRANREKFVTVGVMFFLGAALASCSNEKISEYTRQDTSSQNPPSAVLINEQLFSPTPKIDEIFPASPFEEEPQGMSQEERERIIRESDNSWTLDELNEVIKEFWPREGSIEEAVKAQRYGGSCFHTYLFFDNYSLIYFHGNSPYRMSTVPLTERISGIEKKINVYDPVLFSHVIQAQYVHYMYTYLDTEEITWDKAKDYVTILYITEEMDENGEMVNGFYLMDGGYFDVDKDNNVVYIAPEDKASLSDEKLALVDQGFCMFVETENGIVGRANKKKTFGEEDTVLVQ